MEWYAFIYKGLRTNIEFNKLGEVKRLPTEWMVKKEQKNSKIKA